MGELRAADGGAAARLRGGGAAARGWCSRLGVERCRPRTTCAATSSPGAAPVSTADRVAPARRAAYEVLRRTFEDGAWADRALPAAVRAPSARRPRQGARAAAGVRGGPAPRDARSPDRACSPIAPPRSSTRRCSRRCGSVSTSCCSRPGRPTTRQSTRRSSSRSVQTVGGVEREGGARASSTPCCAERSASATPFWSGSTTETPAAAAVAHSHPRWLAEMWWAELGADDARALMAADNEPAETALRVNTLRAEPDRAGERAGRRGDGDRAPGRAAGATGVRGR